MTITQIAQTVHEIQKSFCESIGDYSLPAWEVAGDMQRNTIQGVVDLLNNTAAAAGFSHEQWMKNKINDGWKLGPVKNWETKEHPALIPFAELPVHEQTKDYLFVQTVRSLQKFVELGEIVSLMADGSMEVN
jgi:hypothetical protein